MAANKENDVPTLGFLIRESAKNAYESVSQSVKSADFSSIKSASKSLENIGDTVKSEATTAAIDWGQRALSGVAHATADILDSDMVQQSGLAKPAEFVSNTLKELNQTSTKMMIENSSRALISNLSGGIINVPQRTIRGSDYFTPAENIVQQRGIWLRDLLKAAGAGNNPGGNNYRIPSMHSPSAGLQRTNLLNEKETTWVGSATGEGLLGKILGGGLANSPAENVDLTLGGYAGVLQNDGSVRTRDFANFNTDLVPGIISLSDKKQNQAQQMKFDTPIGALSDIRDMPVTAGMERAKNEELAFAELQKIR